MAASSSKKREPRVALDSLAEPSSSSKFDVVSKVILSPFTKKHDSNKIFSDLAPVIMTPRMVNTAATVSSRSRPSLVPSGSSRVDFATLGRAPLKLGFGSRRVTSRDLQIFEATDELLHEEVPEPEGVAQDVSLLRGFKATIPSSEKGRTRRRQTRNVETPNLGLKRLGLKSRGMLGEEEDHEGESVASEDDMVMVSETRGRKTKSKKRRGRQSLSAGIVLGKDELLRQSHEIELDKENLHVRRTLISAEINEITHKIEALDAIRSKLEQDLLKLQEEELELDDELEGVRERLELEESTSRPPKSPTHGVHLPQSSRRRKGPAFLPSEHDDLPPGVAFMTLPGHTAPISALDFSEPYGTLVTASQEDAQPRVWDLLTGEEIGRLRGHQGTVKCIQVEDHVCLTGGEDGTARLWDLRRVDNDEWEGEVLSLSDVAEEDEGIDEFGAKSSQQGQAVNGGTIRQGGSTNSDNKGPCARVLEGHSKAVTALYFEEDCLVTGAADKTMRQWDLTTGQCVMTMDILWAISHPPTAGPGGPFPNHLFPGAAAAAGNFAVPTPPYADGSWDMYTDFVGAVQFWGYALMSGSGDGVVRMWDMRTGQPHRTLLGHTGPVTSLQFDELHVVSGSLDKSIRIWDIRTGGIFETLKYDHAVTALQFDSRKIVAAAGENGLKVYNRTSMQHSTLTTNGHTRPVERLRYMDRYLVSGGRDSVVKVWAL